MHISFFFRSDNFDLPFFHPMSMNIELIVSTAWSLDLARRHQIYKMSCLSFGLLMNCCYTSWWFQFLPTYFYLNYAINVFVDVTNYCVELGADNKNLSTIILPWVDFSCAWKCNRNFIHATVKAAFLFFLSLSFSLKWACESVAYFLQKPLIKTEKVDEWLSYKMNHKSFSWWVIFNSDSLWLNYKGNFCGDCNNSSLSPCSMSFTSLLLRKQPR